MQPLVAKKCWQFLNFLSPDTRGQQILDQYSTNYGFRGGYNRPIIYVGKSLEN